MEKVEKKQVGWVSYYDDVIWQMQNTRFIEKMSTYPESLVFYLQKETGKERWQEIPRGGELSACVSGTLWGAFILLEAEGRF